MALTKTSVPGGVTFTESLTLPDSGGATATTASTSSISKDDLGILSFSDKKFAVWVIVTETCAGDGAIDLKVQVSPDNTNWIDADATVGLDVDPTGENSGYALADLTNVFAPYMRLQAFTDGTDTVDDATVTLGFAITG